MSMFACEALTCVHGCSVCAFTTKQITQVDFGNTTFGNMCTLKDIQSKRITLFHPHLPYSKYRRPLHFTVIFTENE